jgi:ABC-type multidrug transport system fused ATPase/permease subunit
MIKQILNLFNKFPKFLLRKFYIMQIFITLNSIFQLLSILSIGPFVVILSGKNNFAFTNQSFFLIKGLDSTHILILSSVFIFTLFLCSNLLTAFSYSLQQKFSQDASAYLSYNILEKFYHKSYSENIELNSTYYKSLIDKEINALTGNVLMPLCDLNSKIFPVALLLSAVFLINPKAATLIFIFLGLVYLVIYLIVKKKLSTYSKIIVKDNYKISKLIYEILKSYKEAKIFNFENYFLNKFKKLKLNTANTLAKNIILQVIPRQFFEVAALGIIMIAIFTLINSNNQIKSFSTLAIYLAAGYRILPNLQSILFSVSSIKGNEKSIYIINKFLEQHEESCNKNNNFKNINTVNNIKIKNLNFSYKNNEIFKNINLNFKKGDITGIFGNSGAGKTTLINIIMSFMQLNKNNNILINNKKINSDLTFLRDFISFVPQDTFILNDNVIKNISFKDKISNQEYLKIYHLLKILKLIKFLKGKKISKQKISEDGKNLSGGLAQRIALARCLFKKSQIIILDEFTSNLDNYTEKYIFRKVKELFKNKIVIIISHKENIKNYCDKVYILKNKKFFISK